MVDVLALHGSPGLGKSTLARALSEALRATDTAHGVIDLDDIGIVHPYPGRQFPLDNLRVIYPHYLAAAPSMKLIIPMVFADEQEVGLLREAAPGARLIICEVTAPVPVLKSRVTAREPTEEWRSGLRNLVDFYHSFDHHARIRDFQVSTHPSSVEDCVATILDRAGWR